MPTVEPNEDGPGGGPRQGRTTILLTKDDRGRWRATQRGVDVEGRGDTAAGAAAAYCRRIDELEE